MKDAKALIQSIRIYVILVCADCSGFGIVGGLARQSLLSARIAPLLLLVFCDLLKVISW